MKAPPTNPHTLVRLDQLLVSRGWGSRKEVTQLIRGGWVSDQNGVLKSAKYKLPYRSELWIKGEHSYPPPLAVLFHKPLNMLSTYRDPWGRQGLDHVLPKQWTSLLHPVGRLDRDTTGLLIFSLDGQLTQTLLHPRHQVPKTYRARVDVVPSNLAELLQQGVQTALGTFHGQIDKIEGYDVTLTVYEGKHRMVRRMLHNAGASVIKLHRLTFGPLALGDLKEGEYRIVNEQEIHSLTSMMCIS